MKSRNRLQKLERVLPRVLDAWSGSCWFSEYSISARVFDDKARKLHHTFFGFKNEPVIRRCGHDPVPEFYAPAQELLDGFMTPKAIEGALRIADKPLEWWYMQCLGDILDGSHRIEFDLADFGLGEFVPYLPLYPDIEYAYSSNPSPLLPDEAKLNDPKLAEEMTALADILVSSFTAQSAAGVDDE